MPPHHGSKGYLRARSYNQEEKMKRKKERIASLQALRALAFLGIFFAHSGFFISWSSLGVSIFFVLSGYLMTYSSEGKKIGASLSGNAKMAVSRIRSLYPLHIITMILAAVLAFIVILRAQNPGKEIPALLGEILLNVFLLQSWFPDSRVNVSLNGVAWYLSVSVFLYFIFPWILLFIRKCSKRALVILCVLILAVQLAGCIPFIHFLGNENPVYIWYMYCFPVFRAGDFFIGCCLGIIYKRRPFANARGAAAVNTPVLIRYTAFEAAATILTTITYLWLSINHTNLFQLAFHNQTTVFIPLAVLWIYLFAEKKGLITAVLSNRLLYRLGNISSYLFLIHFVVIRYFIKIVNHFGIDPTGWLRLCTVAAEFALSVLLSHIWADFFTSRHHSARSQA